VIAQKQATTVELNISTKVDEIEQEIKYKFLNLPDIFSIHNFNK
jgi:hypothetical protein